MLAELATVKQEQAEEAQRQDKIKRRVVNAFWDVIKANESIESKAELATSKAQRVLLRENQLIKERMRK